MGTYLWCSVVYGKIRIGIMEQRERFKVTLELPWILGHDSGTWVSGQIRNCAVARPQHWNVDLNK